MERPESTSRKKLFVVEVIPIARSIGKETLSYFATSRLTLGSIVRVPLRKGFVPAIIVECHLAEDMRSEIRGMEFQMKKITTAGQSTFLSEAFIQSAKISARFFAGTTGGVIRSFVPKTIIESAHKLGNPKKRGEIKGESRVYIIQTGDVDRFTYYKSVIREAFSKKRSVFFCLPTLHDIKRASETLPRGIEEYAYFFHAGLPKKEMVRAWKAITESPHPVLIIGTGSILSLPRADIGTIIIDRESAGAYKFQTRPYADVRTQGEYLARELGAMLVLGDSLLRTETINRRESGEVVDHMPLSFRIASNAKCEKIDVRKERDSDREFKPISDQVLELIGEAQIQKEKTFLYVTRRGLSPLTLCGDCGTIVLCRQCSAPVVLHKNSQGHYFLCHRCGEKRSAEERCLHCSSWKLTTLGIGSERIESLVKEKFPDAPIIRLDKETAPTMARGIKAISTFYTTPGAILIGTEMALLYLDRPIENAAVISIDSLFSIPDFRIHEKIMNILSRIRSRTEKKFLVQTRYDQAPIITWALQGNISAFYREEIQERKKFRYPPFATLIKITYRGEKERAWREMEKAVKLLLPHELILFPAFIESVKGMYVVHGLIRLPPGEWVDETLHKKLISLPFQFSVNVDPENLL